MLREEVEAAVTVLKMGTSAGVDNIPAELVQLVKAGGEDMTDILTSICYKIWKTGEWPTTWAQSLVIALPKKGNLQLCQNYRTISLISHHSKVMLKIILKRLSHKQKGSLQKSKQVSEPEGASQNKYSISGSSTRNTCSISRLHNPYNVFIDFKKADMVWHEALWATMRKYNINASIIRAIVNLFDKAQSAVLFSGSQ